MSVKINTLASLQKFTQNQQGIEVNGTTVGQCLEQFVSKYPAAKPALFDQVNRLYAYIEIYVNGRNVYPELLNHNVKDGDEIFLSIAIGGG